MWYNSTDNFHFELTNKVKMLSLQAKKRKTANKFMLYPFIHKISHYKSAIDFKDFGRKATSCITENLLPILRSISIEITTAVACTNFRIKFIFYNPSNNNKQYYFIQLVDYSIYRLNENKFCK